MNYSQTKKKIEKLRAELEEQHRIAEEAQKRVRKTVQELAKAEVSVVIPSLLQWSFDHCKQHSEGY